jgi:hypothetical protein
MESLSIESCRGLKSVTLGTGLQSCELQLPLGPDLFAKKLPDVDIINLCHLGGSAKGLVISDLLFTQNQDLEAVWIWTHPTRKSPRAHPVSIQFHLLQWLLPLLMIG